jgi:RNA polymerase sigma-54 factor
VELRHSQNQRLEQSLKINPQLQQAIRLLQLSRAELAESIADALAENPILEEVPMADSPPGEQASALTGGEGGTTGLEAPAKENTATEVDWQEYFTSLSRGPSEGSGWRETSDDEKPSLAQTLSRGSTLAEHLEEQLMTTELSELHREIARGIVGDLDDDGYFRPSKLDVSGPVSALEFVRRMAENGGVEVETTRDGLRLMWLTDSELDDWYRLAVAKGCDAEITCNNALSEVASRYPGAAVADVRAVLALLHLLDPLGVASADLRECLLIQVRHRYENHPDRDTLLQLVDKHLPDLMERNVQVLRRSLGVTAEDIDRLQKLLAALEPRPGRRFTGETARYITPDVFVVKVGDEYVVTINEDGLPKLRLSSAYRGLLEREDDRPTKRSRDPNQLHADEARKYLQEKMNAAKFMINSIHRRQSTIQRVTESIMRFQRAFLDQGTAQLRPLILADVAADVGLHESTVSRVTTSKYVHTPQGIFELKYFFSARISAQGGEDMAAEAVKSRIKRLVDREPGTNPLSDQDMTDILEGRWTVLDLATRLNISEAVAEPLLPDSPMRIARRTVAKYREALHIASSSQRRKRW